MERIAIARIAAPGRPTDLQRLEYMSDDRTIQTLNTLLAAEHGNLIQRLAEADAYVSWPEAADHVVVQRMIDDVQRHQRELAEMIIRLRGAPIPPTYPTNLGGVHYLSLGYLMPQVIASVKGLIQRNETVGSTSDPEAHALIARILRDHKRHLAELQRIHASMQPA
jgi:hypothetical protein